MLTGKRGSGASRADRLRRVLPTSTPFSLGLRNASRSQSLSSVRHHERVSRQREHWAVEGGYIEMHLVNILTRQAADLLSLTIET